MPKKTPDALPAAASDVRQCPDNAPLIAAVMRYREAYQAAAGPNRPGADYAALYRERDAALGQILRWADEYIASREAAGA